MEEAGIDDKNESTEDLNSSPFCVRAFQVRQDDGNDDNVDYLKQDDVKEIGDGEQAVLVSYYERLFPIGSTFSFPVQATAPRKKGVERNPATIRISSGIKLSIRTVSVDPMTTKLSRKADNYLSLYLSTDTNPDYLCICPILSASLREPHSTVASLNVEVCGPSVIHLAAHCHTHDESVGSILSNVNVFGTVSLLEPLHGKVVAEAKNKSLEQLRVPMITDGEEGIKRDNAKLINRSNKKEGKQQQIDKIPATIPTKTIVRDDNQTRKQTLKSPTKQPKRKAAVLENNTINSCKAGESSTLAAVSNGVKDNTTTETSPKPMTKKQRRKQAKQKATELEEAIAREQGYPTMQEREQSAKDDEQRSKTSTNVIGKRSLTRKRFIPGGIIVQDLLHGLGQIARTGRKVTINYRGIFPETGKVFDKNLSKEKPLVFRLGTGEVIKGLERGIDGMKVGGERVITIPPKFGYGEAGQPDGGIPKNATLCFEVTLISIGGQ